MSVYICTYLRNHHPAQDTNHPQHPEGCLLLVLSVTHPTEGTAVLTSVSGDQVFPVLKLHINGIMQHELVWLLSFNTLCPLKPSTLCVAIVLFYWWVICLMNILQLINPCNCWRVFELFPVWKLWIKLLWTFFYMLFGEHTHLFLLRM